MDIHVGSRVRLRRMMKGLSQEKLGEELGLTFQQVQKYEKGVNRVGASRLFDISRILEVPVQFFYDDFDSDPTSSMIGLSEDTAPSYSSEKSDFFATLQTPEGMQLTRAFVRISDPQIRRSILDLVKTLSDDEDLED